MGKILVSVAARLGSGALLRARIVVSGGVSTGLFVDIRALTIGTGTQNGGTMAPVSEGDHLLISCKSTDYPS